MRFDAHQAHQALRAFAIHAQFERHFAAAVKRPLQVQLVEPPHQPQVFGALRLRLVIIGRARQAQQFALSRDGQLVFRADPFALVFKRGGQLFF